MLEDHFVGDAMGFANHPSRRIIRMELVTISDNIQYQPYDVRRA